MGPHVSLGKDPERQQSITPGIITHSKGLQKSHTPTGNQETGCIFRMGTNHGKEIIIPVMWLKEGSEDRGKIR